MHFFFTFNLVFYRSIIIIIIIIKT